MIGHDSFIHYADSDKKEPGIIKLADLVELLRKHDLEASLSPVGRHLGGVIDAPDAPIDFRCHISPPRKNRVGSFKCRGVPPVGISVFDTSSDTSSYTVLDIAVSHARPWDVYNLEGVAKLKSVLKNNNLPYIEADYRDVKQEAISYANRLLSAVSGVE